MEDPTIPELFEILTPDRWRLHFGDQNVFGWTITVTYFLVSFLCLRAALYSVKNGQSNLRADRIMWLCIAFILLMLGINKQLDLQTLLTSVGREIAKAQGWYYMRRKVQAVFVLIAALSCVLIMVVMFRRFKDMLRQNRLVFVGLVCLAAFILIRTASFYHVDYMFRKHDIFMALNMKIICELGALIIVGAGVQLSLHKTKSKRDTGDKYDT